MPIDEDELANVPGIGEKRLEMYGDEILAILDEVRESRHVLSHWGVSCEHFFGEVARGSHDRCFDRKRQFQKQPLIRGNSGGIGKIRTFDLSIISAAL